MRAIIVTKRLLATHSASTTQKIDPVADGWRASPARSIGSITEAVPIPNFLYDLENGIIIQGRAGSRHRDAIFLSEHSRWSAIRAGTAL
jgi:hypothetical protein